MIVKERIQELIKDNFYVDHKALGKTQMHENLDYVRIYDKAKKGNAIQIINISKNMVSDIDKKISQTIFNQRRNMACWWRNSIRFVYLILRNMNILRSGWRIKYEN